MGHWGGTREDFRGLTREERRIVVGLQRFGQEMGWINEHYSKLQEQYPAQFIAVSRRRVVDADPVYPTLLDRLAETYSPRIRSRIVTEFIHKKGEEPVVVNGGAW